MSRAEVVWLRKGASPPPQRPKKTVVTQLVLLIALSLIGVALSFGFGRMELRRGSVSSTVKRVEGAVERAGQALIRLSALRAIGLLAVPAVGLIGFALLGDGTGAVSSGGRAVFLLLALLGGAATALLQARLVVAFGARAAASAAQAVARGSARGLRPLLRAPAAIAVFGDGLGLLALAAAFASLYAIRGGFAAAAPSVELARDIAELLPAFALGAALTALGLSRDGSVAAVAARVGGSHVSEQDAALEGDARDPSLLATLVGQTVGELLPRAMLGYVCGLSVTVSVALLTAASATGATLASLVLLLLVRAFGVVASLCGVLAARVTDDEAPSRALLRGQICAAVVSVFGLGAATFWQAREHLGAQLAAGALGLLAMLLVSWLAWLPLRRGARPLRELSDAQQSGDAAAIVRGAGAGFAALLPALLIPSLAFASAEAAFAPAAPVDALLVAFTAGALSLLPFAQAVAGVGLLAGSARGFATLARLEAEAKRRGSKLDDAATLASALGSTHLSLAVANSALLGLLAFSAGQAKPAPIGALGMALAVGVTLILLSAGRALRSALLGARLVTQETQRQLAGLPRQNGVTAVPADFTPSYKTCVEATLEAARSSSSVEALVAVAAPFLLAALWRWGSPSAGTTPLLGFALAALLGGLSFVIASRAARAVLGELRRKLRGPEVTPRTPSALQSENFGELVGVSAAASVEALALVLALTVLCLAPLMS